MAVAAHRIYACARCGKRSTAERMVFSTFSRAHYCSAIDACARRAHRNSKNKPGPVRTSGTEAANGARQEGS